jgi:hypothetical protein
MSERSERIIDTLPSERSESLIGAQRSEYQ